MKFNLIIRSGHGTPRDPIVHTIAIEADTARGAQDQGYDLFDAWREETGFSGRSGQNTTLRYIPQVGDGAHYGGNGDSYPCTIIEMSKSGHRVTVQADTYRVIPGKGGMYEGPKPALFSPDPNGATRVFTRRKDGSYREKGCNWATLGAGRRTAYNPHI